MRHSWAVLVSAVVFNACGGDENVTFSSDGIEAGSEAAAGSGGSSGGSGGTAGTGGTGSTAGSGSTDAGSDASEPDADAAEPDGATEGDSGAGDAADDSPAPDAGTDACARPTVYYADKDRDRYGSPSTFVTACSPPPGNWALTASDCNDGDSRVHPGQAAYFGTPYKTPSGASSFDYDCSGSEEEDRTQTKAPANCGLFSLALCGGEGYAKTARTGPGLSPYCGSDERSICQAALGILVCETVTEKAEEPFRCK